MSADKDVTWGSSGDEDVTFPDDSLDILPSTVIDFGTLSTLPAGSLVQAWGLDRHGLAPALRDSRSS